MSETEKTMHTALVRVDPGHIDPAVMECAGGIIKNGGLVAFPTETVYGLGGDALSAGAARKIYAAKGRPSDNPLIVHIADMEALPPIVKSVPPAAIALANAFWPGPLTMIFMKTDRVPDETSGGLPTVAVRMPVDPVAAALIRASGGYIAAPSANRSGRPSPTSARHVMEDMDGRIEMVLDGGDANIGLESTIVDLTEETPVILRPGFISPDMLRDVIGDVRLDPGLLDAAANKGVRPKAPGMRYRHYAPNAPLYVVEGSEQAVTAGIAERSARAIQEGKCVGIMASDKTAALYEELLGSKAAADGDAGRALKDGNSSEAVTGGKAVIFSIGNRDEDITIARRLFSVLREFDDSGADVIYSESFDTPKLGMAIMNRLLKAAGHQIIKV